RYRSLPTADILEGRLSTDPLAWRLSPHVRRRGRSETRRRERRYAAATWPNRTGLADQRAKVNGRARWRRSQPRRATSTDEGGPAYPDHRPGRSLVTVLCARR